MKVHTKNDTGISMMPPASALPFTASRSATLACLLVAATGLPGAAAAATPNGTAASAALECPATVQLEAPRATASGLPAGTEIVLDARPLRLTGYNFFDGPPAQGAALVPTSDKPGKGTKGAKGAKSESTATWVFEGDYPQGKFASCDYAGGTVRLVRRMDDGAKRCTATSRTAGDPPALQVQFRCE